MPDTLIGTNLRRIREARRLTQRDLAELTGIDHSHIARIECGITTDPRSSTLARIAEKLNLNIQELYHDHPATTGTDPGISPA